MLSNACVRASASDIDIPEDSDAGDGGTISVTAQKPQQDQPHRPQATAGLLSRPASHRSLESKRHRSTPPFRPGNNAHLSYITGGKPIRHIPSQPPFMVCSGRLRADHHGRKCRQGRSLRDYRQAVDRAEFSDAIKAVLQENTRT